MSPRTTFCAAGVNNGTCAYGIPALGEFGNAGVGTERAPGFFNLDSSIGKNFNITERHRIEFRAELFNILNSVSWGAPGRDITDSGELRRHRQSDQLAAHDSVRSEVRLLILRVGLRACPPGRSAASSLLSAGGTPPALSFLEDNIHMRNPFTGLTRRSLFTRGSLLAAVQGMSFAPRTAAADPLVLGNAYRSIGVRPVINARGTFTIITGSTTLPEVKKAMEEASRSFVQMDELMDAVGKRLAEISGAEWGMISAGCAAGLTHCTAAAIAGGNPERMQRLPNLAGLKSEVIVPAYSHNVYDHAIRMLGVKLVVVKDKAELDAAFNERTAMAYILAGPGDEGPLGTTVVAEACKRHKVPAGRRCGGRGPDPEAQCPPGSAARTWWRTAEASASAGRRRRECCSARRISCRPRGSTALRTMPSAARSRSARKRSSACSPRSRCGSSATIRPSGPLGNRGSTRSRLRSNAFPA